MCAQRRFRSAWHSRSLIRIFTGAFRIAKDAKFLHAVDGDWSDWVDAPAIWSYAGRTCQKKRFWVDCLQSSQSIHIHQNFLMFLATWLSLTNEIKSLFIDALFLSLWRQSAMLRGLSVKPWQVYWQTVQTQIRRRVLRRLIWVCIVCLNNRKSRFKWNCLKYPFRTLFPDFTQTQSTHQCSQYFDVTMWL